MARSLPGMLIAILSMLIMCAAWAWLLSLFTSTSFLTAYLATTPGGLDSVIAIAMGTNADMNFVVAVQTLRVFAVLLLGPWLAKALSRTKMQAEI